MTTIRESEIKENLLSFVKPDAHSGKNFPFTELNDRAFEILLYQIFKARIEYKDNTILGRFDNVALMQGVGEKGRDCVLYKSGKSVGLIQCKQINKNISKPETIKEIAKFCINAIIDRTLIPDLDDFTYFFAVSKGLAGTTIELLNDFNVKVLTEQKLDSIIEDLLNSYAGFKHLKLAQIKTDLITILQKIQVKYIIPADLTQFLFDYDHLIKNFFRILTVTDNSLLEYIVKTYLEPTLKKLYPDTTKEFKDFRFRFKEYLERSLNNYSSSKTLIFGNQQKKLEDFYYPLTLLCKNDKISKQDKSYNTLKYEDKLLPTYKKVLIVDNGGMGKSTIMKWLYLSALKQRKGIPVFIELRKLKNTNTVIDEIIKELKPIDENLDVDIVNKLIAQGNFIFFFDGYDEISDENRGSVTSDLQLFISKAQNNLFILTSRPETALNTFSDFQEFNIKKLEPNEAFDLIKKIGENSDKALRLIEKIKEKKLSNVSDFLHSPLLVSLLYRKFDYRETIPIKLQEFYYEVFEALFQAHDLTKGDSYIRDKKTKLSLSDFFQILRELGFYTLKIDDLEYNHATLSNYLDEIAKRLPNINFKTCDFITDIVKAVPLFNREGLTYRWAHKSFQEYFSAEFICRDTKDKQIQILQKMSNSARVEKFRLIFSLCYDIDYKSFRKAIIYPKIVEFIDYYNNSYKDFEQNKEIKLLDIRKSLTFNTSYVIVLNSKDEKLPLDFSKSEMKDIVGENITKLVKPDYKLKSIMLSHNLMLVTASQGIFLKELLSEKGSSLLRTIDLNKEDFDDINNWKLKGMFTIDDNKNSELNSVSLFDKTTKLLVMHERKQYLDIQKCKEFVTVFEKEQELEKEDYFFDGL